MNDHARFPRIDTGRCLVSSPDDAETELIRLSAAIRDRKKAGLPDSRLLESTAQKLAAALAEFRGTTTQEVLAGLEPEIAAREGTYLVISSPAADETAAEWAEAVSPASRARIARMTRLRPEARRRNAA